MEARHDCGLASGLVLAKSHFILTAPDLWAVFKSAFALGNSTVGGALIDGEVWAAPFDLAVLGEVDEEPRAFRQVF